MGPPDFISSPFIRYSAGPAVLSAGLVGIKRTMKTLVSPLIVALMTSVALADMPVVFPDNKKFAEGDGRDFLVVSSIPGDFKTPEGVVGAMLWLGDKVRNTDLTAPFSPAALKGTSHFEGAHPLGAYYRGARIDGKMFVIAFSREAMRYLNNTVSIQQAVKGALEGTIKKSFPKVESIAYEIDGKINTEWDG